MPVQVCMEIFQLANEINSKLSLVIARCPTIGCLVALQVLDQSLFHITHMDVLPYRLTITLCRRADQQQNERGVPCRIQSHHYPLSRIPVMFAVQSYCWVQYNPKRSYSTYIGLLALSIPFIRASPPVPSSQTAALCAAAEMGVGERVQKLLARKCDPNVKNVSVCGCMYG